MPLKVKKIKQKQKQKQRQKQHQSVVVNVHTTRRAPRKSKTPSTKSLGTNYVPYPVYTNAYSDYAPIIHNLPAQFQNQPAISLPVEALANVSTVNPVSEYISPTRLQTNGEDNRPLISTIKKKPLTSLIEELKRVQEERGPSRLGDTIIGSNIRREPFIPPGLRDDTSRPEPDTLTPLNTRLLFEDDSSVTSLSRLSSPAMFRASPSSAFTGFNPMKLRKADLKGLPEEQLRARKQHYDAERYKNRKVGPR